MLKIRLARRGRRNLNTFAIVVAESKFKRDGRFVEKLGYYQPILKDEDPYRMKLHQDRYEHWIKMGAQPTEKVVYIAAKLGFIPALAKKTLTKKSEPKKKAQERAKEKAKSATVAE